MSYDYDGELIVTYEVSVWCNKKMVLHLGLGYSAVARFVKIAEAGIPEAKKIEKLWETNYNVTFTGEGLTAFLRKHYPELEEKLSVIDPKEEYLLDCYDMS